MASDRERPAVAGPVGQVVAAYDQGHAALFVTGRALDDLVVDGDDMKLRPLREALRRQLRVQHGLALVSYTLATQLDWDAPRLEAPDRDAVEQALRPHGLLEPGHDVPRLLQGIARLCRDPGKERRWPDGDPLRFALVLEHAEHLVPGGLANGTQTEAQMAAVELLSMMATSLALRASGNLIVLHGREGLVDTLVAGSLHPVRLLQPDFDEKFKFLQVALQLYSAASFAPGLSIDAVARLTARTPNRSQEAQLRASHRTAAAVTCEALVHEKTRDLEQASEGTLRVLDTARVEGVVLQGRNIVVPREYLAQCAAGLATGDRTTPINIILAGPPATGKTDLALAVARDANASAFEVVSPKGGIVGDTERRARLQRLGLTEWTPNVGVIDEINDAMPLERGAFDGDNGASRAVTAALLGLLSDESRRGKSIIIGTTNAPQRVCAAMRSRFVFVPVLSPVEADLPAIIVALAKRIAPDAKVDMSQPAIKEAAGIFFRKGASPREIARSLRKPITPKSILEAARDLCAASDRASASFAELWAIKACTSKALFPWAKDPSAYPYPQHLDGLVDPETGDLRRDELDRRIQELEPHAHV